VAAVDDGIGIPAGADARASTGVGGALATTDAEGSDGSEAGVATALAGAVIETEGVPSCGCLEQAASARANANDRRNGADFMVWLSQSSQRYSIAVSMQHPAQSSRLGTTLVRNLSARFVEAYRSQGTSC
jgi:hypothetical protein